MLIILFIIVFVLETIAQPSNQGPFQAGWTSVSLNRDGRNFNALIYYPSFIEGSEAQIDTLNGPYQPIAFGHGFFMQNSYYISIYKHLASYGFIVIAPQFPDNNHLQLGYDLIHCIKFIQSQNTNQSSRFFSLVDTTKSGLSGHSMGGGASLLAAAYDSTITVVAPLAAAETNPSAINAMNQIKGVVYLIAAQNDGITPVNSNQLPMYNNSNPVKALVNIKGANHTKFMDTRVWDWTDPNGYLTASQQLLITRKYLAGIFNLCIKEDSSYFKYSLGNLAQNDTSIIFQSVLKPLVPKSFNLISPKDTLYQNDVSFLWNSTYSLNLFDEIRYDLTVALDDQFNNIVLQVEQLSDTTYTTQFQNGMYYWKVKAYSSDSTSVFSDELNFFIDSPINVQLKENQPTEFSLNQNYPNPFNPSTWISWQSPVRSWQTIKVYDVLGNEVATLVDEYKPAGYYSIEFDGSRLSSGVYFYSIRSGDYFEVKKMNLMK